MSRLLDLPHDLLIQEILARIPWPTLSQCLLVNKSLFGTITSSPILNYHRALFLASMVDNPRSSFSLPEKIAMLQEREKRWRKLEPKVVMERKQDDEGRGDWLSVAAEDGAIIYANMCRGGSINLGIFPSSLAGTDGLRWNDIPFEGQDAPPIGFCTAIDESDLVAVGFQCVISSPVTSSNVFVGKRATGWSMSTSSSTLPSPHIPSLPSPSSTPISFPSSTLAARLA